MNQHVTLTPSQLAFSKRRASMLKKIEGFNINASVTVTWDGEYMPFSGGCTTRPYRRPMMDIAREVLVRYPDITIEEVKGPRRGEHLIKARFAIINAIKRERPDLSYPQIGKFLGGRDHTTIISAVRCIERRKAKKEWDDL